MEFDDQGVRSAWMSSESRQQFDERLECITNQYSNAFQTVLTYNGTDTVIRVSCTNFTFLIIKFQINFLKIKCYEIIANTQLMSLKPNKFC